MTKRDFSHVRRIVIKAGTNILSSKDGINMERVRSIVDQIAKAKGLRQDSVWKLVNELERKVAKRRGLL